MDTIGIIGVGLLGSAIAARLTAAGHEVELVPITTTGDAQQKDRIGNLGSPGVVTGITFAGGTLAVSWRRELVVHIPTESGHGFQSKADNDSKRIRTKKQESCI